ncbi:MAG: hypothetical protein ABI323_01205 [Solirubrobacteraceae bacterium]
MSGSQSAASLELASGGVPVMAIGGFDNQGGNISLAQFKAYVAKHEIHHYIAGSTRGGGAPGEGARPTGSRPPGAGSSPGGGRPGGFGGRGRAGGAGGPGGIGGSSTWNSPKAA